MCFEYYHDIFILDPIIDNIWRKKKKELMMLKFVLLDALKGV